MHKTAEPTARYAVAEGDRLIIEAVKPRHPKGSPAALLAALEEIARLGPTEEEFPDVDAGLLPLDDIDLERG